MIEEKAKPCPFCGNKDKKELSIRVEMRLVGSFMWPCHNVVCSCGAQGPDSSSRKAAIERWNTRYDEENECEK